MKQQKINEMCEKIKAIEEIAWNKNFDKKYINTATKRPFIKVAFICRYLSISRTTYYKYKKYMLQLDAIKECKQKISELHKEFLENRNIIYSRKDTTEDEKIAAMQDFYTLSKYDERNYNLKRDLELLEAVLDGIFQIS